MAQIIRANGNQITIEHTFNLSGDMLEVEESILRSCNDIGRLATKEKLSRYDTDGGLIKIGPIFISSKGKVEKMYETPYGTISLDISSKNVDNVGIVRQNGQLSSIKTKILS